MSSIQPQPKKQNQVEAHKPIPAINPNKKPLTNGMKKQSTPIPEQKYSEIPKDKKKW